MRKAIKSYEKTDVKSVRKNDIPPPRFLANLSNIKRDRISKYSVFFWRREEDLNLR